MFDDIVYEIPHLRKNVAVISRRGEDEFSVSERLRDGKRTIGSRKIVQRNDFAFRAKFFREKFDLAGTPLRIEFRTKENPFVKDDNKR